MCNRYIPPEQAEIERHFEVDLAPKLSRAEGVGLNDQLAIHGETEVKNIIARCGKKPVSGRVYHQDRNESLNRVL